MYKGTIASITDQTTNTNIPFTTKWNTNTNTRYNIGTEAVDIYSPGYYDVIVKLVLTGVTTDVTAQLYSNGAPIAESAVSATVGADTDIVTLTIADTVHIVPTALNSIADISVRILGTTAAADIDVGLITIEKRK